MENHRKKYLIYSVLSGIALIIAFFVMRDDDGENFIKTLLNGSETKKVTNNVVNKSLGYVADDNISENLQEKKDKRSPEEIADEMELEADSELVSSETYKFSDFKKEEISEKSKEDTITATSQALEDTREAIAVSNMLDEFIKKDLNTEKKEDDGKEISEEESFFTVEDANNFNALSEKDDDSGLVAGRTSRKSSINESKIVTATPTPTDTPDLDDEEDKYIVPQYSGQARGYAMLYLMHPKARHTVATELQTLLHSGIREVYLSVLTDGTFGKDYDYLKNVLQIFHEKNRITTLALYLTNGSSMRRYDSSFVEAGFNQIEPKEFRTLIRYDVPTRNKFAEMVREVKPVFDYHQSLSINNKNIAIVMLEDNLNADSYVAMRSIASSVLGSGVKFVRNPCPNCYPGNDAEPVGDPLEFHSPNYISELKSNDGFTLDGVSFYFPWETGRGLSIEDVKALQNQSYIQGAGYFAIWRSQRQGIYDDGVYLPPDERTYEIPSPQQIEIEKSIFKDGLKEISE